MGRWEGWTVRGTVHCVLYIAHCPRPTGSGRKCNLVSCKRESAAFAMPCHARHCATLVAGSQQGRTKRPLAIGGPCRAQNLRPTDQVRAPSSDQVSKSLPPLCSWRVHRIALHCSARHGHGEQRSRVCSTCCMYVSQPDDRHGRAKVPFDRDKPSRALKTWNAVFIHVLSSYCSSCEQRRHLFYLIALCRT